MAEDKFSKRDYTISYIRFIAMLMIILCHFFQYYNNELAFWFNVGVQIFFTISGYLYGKKEINHPVKFIVSQVKKILIPYYLYLIFISIIYLLFVKNSFSLEKTLLSFLCIDTPEGLGHLWFIGYILFCYFITPFLFWIRKKVENDSMFLMTIKYGFIVGVFVIVGTLCNFYFRPDRVCCYIIGYVLSVYCEKYGEKFFKTIGTVIIFISFVVTVFRIYIKYFHTLANGTVMYKLFWGTENYMHMILGIGLFFLFYFIFAKAKNNVILSLSDKYSFSIYIVHQTFILSPLSTMNLYSNNIINWLITLLLILIFGIILYEMKIICSKIINSRGETM